MPVYQIPDQHVFPPPEHADPEGLLGIGGDLDPDRVLLAYRSGIFPWFTRRQPILWWSPDPRMVLFVDELRVPRSLAKVMRRAPYTLTADTAFDAVIDACGRVPRPGQRGTWITPAMRASYTELHRRGHAHSIEAWHEGALVGGLYGVSVGRVFCGESMFATADDASKIAFVVLVRHLARWGYPMVDCQVHTSHLARFGAREISRRDFLDRLAENVALRGHEGPWSLDPDLLGGP